MPRSKKGHLHSRAREMRVKLGYTLQDSCLISGQALRTIQKIEAGELTVHVESLYRLARAYGCSMVDLWPPLAARPKRAEASPLRDSVASPERRREMGRHQRERLAEKAAEIADETGAAI